jgi:hypothetical protein
VLGRNPEIISQVESFTRQYPELPLFIQNGSHTKVLAQDSLPLFTEWDEDESARFAQESQPAPIGGDGRYSPTSLPPTVNEAGQSTKTDLAPADTTTQPKNNLIPATLDRVSSGQLTHEAIVKDARSDALPETLANGATQPGSPSVWMSYAQNPSYAGPWPSMADQNSVGAANAMPQENKTPILSAPFSIPSGSTADFGSFPPGAVPPGPGQFFQHLHGLGAPQYDPRFYPYAAYPPFISRAGPNLQQGNVSGTQMVPPATTFRSALDGFAIPQSGSMDMSSDPSWSGQARDITLMTGDETDDYLNILNDLPEALC